jgi:dethiobiotin synthetase
VLAEGIGGVMSPLTDHHTVLDWMKALGWPVILVTGNYLGAISHTLTALECLKNRRVPLQALIVSESENSSIGLHDTAEALKKFLPNGLLVVEIPRLSMQEPWKHAPNLMDLCQ